MHMKKVLSIMAALGIAGAAVQCFAGAAVFANNYDANKPVFYGAAGTLAPVADTWLQFATAAGAPIGGAFGLTEPGFFDNGFFEVPGAADNADVTFVLQGWKGGAGSTFAAAAESASATISQKAGANPGAPTPPTPAVLAMPDGFTIQVIPEPSTVALALLGGAALLLRRRK
jgi:hypothetical protein